MDIVAIIADRTTKKPDKIAVAINVTTLTLDEAINLRNLLTQNINEFVRRTPIVTPQQANDAKKGDT